MKKIIRVWHGGCGDSLQLSTLPKEFAKQGHEVWISKKTPFRNKEIYDLVWGMNPYVSGITNEEANCGEIPETTYVNTEGAFIKNWEKLNGITPSNDYPEIYYHPKTTDWKGGIVELSSLSLKYNHSKVLNSVYKIMDGDFDNFKQIVSTNQTGRIVSSDIGRITVRNIYELCNYIANCSVFISLSSGPHMLAGALKHIWKGEQHCVLPTVEYDTMTSRKLFILPNVKYIKENE